MYVNTFSRHLKLPQSMLFHILSILLLLTIGRRYFLKMLVFFSSPLFNTDLVKLPCADLPVPPEIKNNPKLCLFFKDALGALDGTHINCCLSAVERQAAKN